MLRRIFGWNQEEKKPDEKPLKRAIPQKRDKPLWIPDGKGGYVKSTTSTAAALMSLAVTQPQDPLPQSYIKEFEPDAGLPQANTRVQAVQSSAVRMDRDEPAQPGEPDHGQVVTSLDALGGYQEQLVKQGAELQVTLEKWKREKEKIIGDDMDLQRYASVKKINANHSVVHGIRAFFENLFEALKADLEPASDELHDLLEKTHAAVQSLCNELHDLSQALKDGNKSAHERHKICIDMCNISMEITEDMIKLVDNIQAELNHCLRWEKISEKAAVQLIALAILIVTKIPVPEMDFNFSSSYRNFLYNEIEQEKVAIDRFETDVKGALRRAMALVTAEERDWTADKNQSPAATPVLSQNTSLQSSLDGLSRLFSSPATPDQTVIQGHDDESSRLLPSLTNKC
ncbi:hypothetical protein AQUSIP_04090 [Aquicella siphonis]|uniref:Uncharacterized protein n=1 Tax=Aquicella siphonis TaxID=254247 RepID=A0A5E4PF48_9COXI|nr:hypothetical protein [Aquicella siphonis]VVC75132.1 hypothetical protein AQUSIP_04090 [Aquicella siphonis]